MITWIGWTAIFMIGVQLLMVPVDMIASSFSTAYWPRVKKESSDICINYHIAMGLVTLILWLIGTAGYIVMATQAKMG